VTAGGVTCQSANAGATATVQASPATPGTAYSAQTWVYGWQTWSDRIVLAPAECANVSSLSELSSPPAQYMVSAGRYYYNWVCVDAVKTTMCPPPWRVPSLDDAYDITDATNNSTLSGDWGFGGFAVGAYVYSAADAGHYWTTTPMAPYAWFLVYGLTGLSVGGNVYRYGQQVRCVR
jgi:hypothetical protein